MLLGLRARSARAQCPANRGNQIRIFERLLDEPRGLQRFGRRLITQMQCSTLRYCYNEKTNTQRLPITGAAILLMMANRNGLRGHAGV